MTEALVDSHSHLDVAEFDPDRPAVLDRAMASGVTRQIVPAIARAGWENLRAVCATHPGLYPAYGLHPILIGDHLDEHVDELREWIRTEQPVALGEIGLDFFIEGLDADRQRSIFRAQLQTAKDFDLPVIVHARRAVEEVTHTVRAIGGLRGVVHSFGGSEEQARQLTQAGFLLGIGGPVTYERANRLRRIVASVPIEFLLLETDSPDQPDAGHRGQRNEPSRLTEILAVVSALRSESMREVAYATTRNAERLFGIGAGA